MAGNGKQAKEHLIAVRLTDKQMDRLRKLANDIGSDGNLSVALRYCVQNTKSPGAPKRVRKPAIRQVEQTEAVA